ncbi:hypothetical protein CC85DRAFT_288585 [Cutaneotrichosporon oleaginosum]|uniref:Uncharacterized protein n=1 Tax=Cutaneotrichosporon oleaginosum TaxID=879819 RepID=A0A0J0XEB3_9TREE|nr:uncharacterized protein CC85DRAFT_288585 [Cutaneotrichosporon oleaginosum]KLT39393.1 hypothetical protein CC85DRAFT_288585 [Cutaneotrichosporon oleaginosum]TXT07544.1 hypothetical protein COLE_04468 [Cutaneotrichosporon oleaginosum]
MPTTPHCHLASKTASTTIDYFLTTAANALHFWCGGLLRLMCLARFSVSERSIGQSVAPCRLPRNGMPDDQSPIPQVNCSCRSAF